MLQRIEHGEVLELRFDREPVNALSPEFVQTLTESITRAPREGARALVLSGRPGMFSAGLDVPALLALDEVAMQEFWKHFFGLLGAIASSPVPIAAAITGHSPAGGAVLSLYCDYRVMAEGDYRIGVNEVQVGLPLPTIIHAALVRQVGVRQAERLGVSGQLLNPSDALRIGLVDCVVLPEQVVDDAVAWCNRLLQLPPNAMRQTRYLARGDLVELFKRLGDSDYRQVNQGWFSGETQATMRALVEQLKKKK